MVGGAVKNEVGKTVATGIDVAVGEHEANIAVMRNAVMIALVFILGGHTVAFRQS